MCMCVRGIDCVYVSTILIFDSDSVVFFDCSDSPSRRGWVMSFDFPFVRLFGVR
jgi:hypothetical protein